jgi:hypothetical protein
MNDPKRVGVLVGGLAGLVLCFLWAIIYHFMEPDINNVIGFIGLANCGWSALVLLVCLLICWNKTSSLYPLRYMLTILYFLLYGFLGVVISSVTGNWLIVPLLLIPFLNVYALCGIFLWIGIIGLGDAVMKALVSSHFITMPLYLVPLTAVLGKAMAYPIIRLRLRLIEKNIQKFEKNIEKHEVILIKKEEIEQNINRIVGLDPNNFGLKVSLYRKRAQTIINDQIQTRIIEIEEDLQKVIQARKQVEDKLRILYNEKDILEQRLKDVDNRLRILEVIDPANIKIKMQKLESAWKGIGKQELERITPAGELEALYKEGLLLNYLIEDKVQEIENMRKELAHLTLNEDILQLERLVFEVEKLDRKIKAEEPRFFEIKDKLSRLEAKRDKIKQFLSENENV